MEYKGGHYNKENFYEIRDLKANNEKIKNIEWSKNKTYYISNKGNLYRRVRNKYYKIKPTINHGYYYVHISLNTKIKNKTKKKTMRLHKLVALYWIPNPDNLPIVGHKDNVKTHNFVENLYWTTYSENTQKAVDDKLMVNAKGYDDNQSYPIYAFYKGKFYKDYGSIKECNRELKIPNSTIARRCNYKRENREVLYRNFLDWDFYFQEDIDIKNV